MNVEFASLKNQYMKYQSEYEEAALRALRSGWYILGEELTTFEADYAAFHGADYCMGVGNGLDALRLALVALGVGHGDEVIVPANTFIATALAVTETGATPVFVEADPFFGMDPGSIEDAMTAKTKAIIPVHLYGQPCDMDRIMEVAGRNGLYVVEDCAQAHGARYKGRLVGTIGDAGCFSFYPMKPIGAFGDSGAVITNNKELSERIKMLRNYGSRIKYNHEIIGINSRMDEIQAAITGVNLKHVEAGNDERKAIAIRYLSGIRNPAVVLPQTRENSEHVYHVFALLCSERDRLQDYLRDHGVQTQIHYPTSCHLAECYRDLGYHRGDFPSAERFASQELSLPIYVGMPDEMIDHVIDTINAFVR